MLDRKSVFDAPFLFYGVTERMKIKNGKTF